MCYWAKAQNLVMTLVYGLWARAQNLVICCIPESPLWATVKNLIICALGRAHNLVICHWPERRIWLYAVGNSEGFDNMPCGHRIWLRAMGLSAEFGYALWATVNYLIKCTLGQSTELSYVL